MDAQDAFRKFISNAGVELSRHTALAFFVGYCYGANGARENIEALIEAFNKAAKNETAADAS